MPRYIDITLPLREGLPVWPGDPHPEIRRIQDQADGAPANVTRLNTVVHTGTHVDAPVHFVAGGAGVESLSLEVLIGPARVVSLPEATRIDAATLDALQLPPDVTRVLFRTRNSAWWTDPAHTFHEDYVSLTPDGARWLVERAVTLVGIDYLSIEAMAEPGHATHHALLEAGVVIIEGLDLRGVAPGAYDLMCLPLKITGADGAPARVVLATDVDTPPPGEAPPDT